VELSLLSLFFLMSRLPANRLQKEGQQKGGAALSCNEAHLTLDRLSSLCAVVRHNASVSS
jgi:hypothetical protein